MHAAFGVDVGGVLFRISGPGQDDVGPVRPPVAVVALIDDEGVAEAVRIDLVGAEQIDDFDAAIAGAIENA